MGSHCRRNLYAYFISSIRFLVMKIALTGHTKGIGKSIYDWFFGDPEMTEEVLGFSRSNGYDIKNKSDREKIIKEVSDCNVFINNAHEEFAQVHMLNELYNSWKETQGKIIINIGVDSVPSVAWQVVHKMYPVEKMALHSAIDILQQESDRCVKITNLALGHVNTEFNEDYFGSKIHPTEVPKAIEWIVSRQDEVKSLVISPKPGR